MPPANKRVKGQRISRMFIIGSEAWPLTPDNRPADIPDDHTTGWKVYIRGIENGPDISTWLKKVQFKLFHTYTNPLRTIENPPFEVTESGWGSFQVEIRLHFQPAANEKPQWRTHFLQLEPYGTEDEKKAQREAGRVVSETVEIIEFNEPTEALWDALTSEAQWDYLPKGGAGADAGTSSSGGGGKTRSGSSGPGGKGGKGGSSSTPAAATNPDPGTGTAAGTGADPEGAPGTAPFTAQLPEKPTGTNPYSKQMEDWLVDVIRKAEAEVSQKLAAAKAALAEKEAEVADLAGTGDLVPTPGAVKK